MNRVKIIHISIYIIASLLVHAAPARTLTLQEKTEQRVKIRNQKCGQNCAAHEKCCLAPNDNGIPAFTYCATQCHITHPEIL